LDKWSAILHPSLLLHHFSGTCALPPPFHIQIIFIRILEKVSYWESKYLENPGSEADFRMYLGLCPYL
jgi:hypothetical protein